MDPVMMRKEGSPLLLECKSMWYLYSKPKKKQENLRMHIVGIKFLEDCKRLKNCFIKESTSSLEFFLTEDS